MCLSFPWPQLPLYSAALAGDIGAGLRVAGATAEAPEAADAPEPAPAPDERLLTGTPSSEMAGFGCCLLPGGGAVGA